MAELDFETASGEELAVWTLKYDTLLRESLAALRDRIVAQVEARVRAETVDGRREAAKKAWQAGYVTGLGYPEGSIITGSLSALDARDRYLARTYPAPAPRRQVVGDFFGVPLVADPTCPLDRVVFEYEGEAVALAVIHPDSHALRKNAATVEGR